MKHRRQDKTVQRSKRLSWLLRHGARETGLPMDEAGWSPVEDVLRHARMTRAQLEHDIATNTKRRIQRDGERVRACQGHSFDGTPVTLEGLEASWRVWAGHDLIWHGTHVEAAARIADEGIHPQRRTHVHMAESLESEVGKRARVAVGLGVSVARLRAAGGEVYVSPNGVLLAREVPPGAVVAVRGLTRRGREAEGDLAARFGLPE